MSAPDLFPEAPPLVPLDLQIACVEREIRMREQVYPRWIDQKKLRQATADRELAQMRAVLATLQSLKKG